MRFNVGPVLVLNNPPAWQEPKAGSLTASTVTVITALATAPWLSVTR